MIKHREEENNAPYYHPDVDPEPVRADWEEMQQQPPQKGRDFVRRDDDDIPAFEEQ